MHENTDGIITYGSGYGAFTARLGDYQPLVEAALDSWDRQQFSRLLWGKDPAPWKQPVAGQREIVKRLGWLTVADKMLGRVEELTSFAQEIKSEGFRSIVVLGMGGSSLSPEVSYKVFSPIGDFPKLFVLDSTVPAAVHALEAQIDLETTLFIVSSKSGDTIETKCAYKYFLAKSSPERFIAITDPRSWLSKEAKASGFRRRFLNMTDIGGRYSALSYFGLVPAALIGVDIERLLGSAREMMEACGPDVTARQNPGVALGAIMAELAIRGRDKLYTVFSPQLQSFGAWVEQLVAESTGKDGQGVLPIDYESNMPANVYPDDCLFVYTKLNGTPRDHHSPDPLTTPVVGAAPRRRESSGDQREVSACTLTDDCDRRLDGLAEGGHPLVMIEIDDPLDLGGQYFLWEIATAAASAFLAVNAFHQPNVAAAKKKTQKFLDKDKMKQELRKLATLAEDENMILYSDGETKLALDLLRVTGPYPDKTPESVLRAHLQRIEPGNYVALMAFIEQADEIDSKLQRFRLLLRDVCNVPTTLGYGPRFLHSTGQFHKGGPNNGLFIQITADDPVDVDIPGEDYSFAVLKDAQALGDFIALREKGRRIIRIHLRNDVLSGLVSLLDITARLLP